MFTKWKGTMLGVPDDRRRRGGGSGRPANPFEMMDLHMSQMMQHMDSMSMGGFAGRGGGSLINQMMGPTGLMGGMGGMGSMFGTGMPVGGCSYSSSSYSCSSGGPGGHSVEYSSSSHGLQRPGEQMVRETHRNYRDSSGQEALGVSRHIGDRGRSVVAERAADGRETRTNNLINIEDGTAFDREWRSNAGANAVTQARMQSRSTGSALGGPAATFALAAPPPTRPHQTESDRAAAREAHRQYEQQRDKLIADARRQREGQTIAAVPSRGAGVPALTLAGDASGYGRHPSSSRTSGTRGGDEALASRLAQQEARRAGLY